MFGKPRDFPSYGWDNEYGYCKMKYVTCDTFSAFVYSFILHIVCMCVCADLCVCSVPEFEATKYPVTNHEFLQFVEDGGYKKTELWTEEGWLRNKTAVA